MAEPLTPKQEHLIKSLEATFLGTEKVLPKDLGVINNPALFPKDKKKDRRYNRAVLHARQEFKLLLFFLNNLSPSYRSKILLSEEFNGILRILYDLQGIGKQDQTDKEKELAIQTALQFLIYSVTVLIKSMPPEFRKTLQDSAKPFVNVVEAISEYGRRNNSKDIPRITISDILYDR